MLDFYSDVEERRAGSNVDCDLLAFGPQALNMSATTALPLLPPTQLAKPTNSPAWEPRRHLQPPQPPVVDYRRIHGLELAVQSQLLDGKAMKKTRPRRTIN